MTQRYIPKQGALFPEFDARGNDAPIKLGGPDNYLTGAHDACINFLDQVRLMLEDLQSELAAALGEGQKMTLPVMVELDAIASHMDPDNDAGSTGVPDTLARLPYDIKQLNEGSPVTFAITWRIGVISQVDAAARLLEKKYEFITLEEIQDLD